MKTKRGEQAVERRASDKAAVLAFLESCPGITKHIAQRCKLTLPRVRRCLRELKEENKIAKCTRFYGSLCYTWVWYVPKNK